MEMCIIEIRLSGQRKQIKLFGISNIEIRYESMFDLVANIIQWSRSNVSFKVGILGYASCLHLLMIVIFVNSNNISLRLSIKQNNSFYFVEI
jgi:hypothetical protein